MEKQLANREKPKLLGILIKNGKRKEYKRTKKRRRIRFNVFTRKEIMGKTWRERGILRPFSRRLAVLWDVKGNCNAAHE